MIKLEWSCISPQSWCKGLFIKDVRTKLQKIDPPLPHVRKMSAMTKPLPPPSPCGHKNALIRHWHTQSFNTKFARFNYILSFNTKFNYIRSLITKFNYILSFNTKFTQSKHSARWRKTYSHVICLCALRALKSHDCTFYAWFTLARKHISNLFHISEHKAI